jgi:methionine biosynthesis protein MetW
MYDDYNHRIFDLVPRGTRVLDVGCATGKLLERLKRDKQCATAGVEMDEAMAQHARARCDRLVVGNAETLDLPFAPCEFDVVIFADVLEHMHDPETIFQKIRAYLKDDGTVFISIPNIAFITARLNLLFGRFDYTDYGIMDRTHRRFFTVKTAKKLVTDCGFRIEHIEGYNQVRDRYFFLRPLGKWWKSLFATDLIIRAVKS